MDCLDDPVNPSNHTEEVNAWILRLAILTFFIIPLILTILIGFLLFGR